MKTSIRIYKEWREKLSNNYKERWDLEQQESLVRHNCSIDILEILNKYVNKFNKKSIKYKIAIHTFKQTNYEYLNEEIRILLLPSEQYKNWRKNKELFKGPYDLEKIPVTVMLHSTIDNEVTEKFINMIKKILEV